MAAGAVVNALWDLAARRAGQPLWRLLSGLSPEQLVNLVDFRYLRDALTENEAVEILRSAKRSDRARSAAPCRRPACLHDHAGMAGLRRRRS
jgi:L-fuconate dehydratase